MQVVRPWPGPGWYQQLVFFEFDISERAHGYYLDAISLHPRQLFYQIDEDEKGRLGVAFCHVAGRRIDVAHPGGQDVCT